MSDILCPECGHDINEHRRLAATKKWACWGANVCLCELTPSDVCRAVRQEASRAAYANVVEHWHASAINNSAVRSVLHWCEQRSQK